MIQLIQGKNDTKEQSLWLTGFSLRDYHPRKFPCCVFSLEFINKSTLETALTFYLSVLWQKNIKLINKMDKRAASILN